MAGKSRLVLFGPFVLAFVGALIMAFVLYGVLVHLKTFSLRAGLISAAFLWFGFVLTTMTVNNAFEQRKAVLTVIDSLHWLGGHADHGRDHRRVGCRLERFRAKWVPVRVKKTRQKKPALRYCGRARTVLR